jgi:SpoVK/Ycf46/Vps4 family AAA+-type ATPase
MAESQAPVVIWIDEVEKAFAGVTGPSGDSGVTQRVFGCFLTWTQERTRPVFIVATANNIRQLPPEFLRKGRFDELFFVDLPTPLERKAILQVLLRKHGLPTKGLVTEGLVDRLDRYTGAEIDCVITEAMYESFYDDQRPVTVKDLETATTKVLPLADQMRSEIEELRRWGKANARPAS